MTDYVMVWDCHYCGHTGIMGYEYDCPGCGKPRSRGVTFYDPPTPIIATSEQMEKMGGQDPNWYCEHCDSGNKQSNDKCWKCGAPRGSSPDNEQYNYEEGKDKAYSEDAANRLQATVVPIQRERRPEATDDPYNPPTSTVRAHDHMDPDLPRFSSSTGTYQSSYGSTAIEPDGSSLKKYGIIGGSLLAVALVIFAIWFFGFNTHKVDAHVTGFAWNQSVSIEEYQTFHEQGWSCPSGGRVTNQEIRQNGNDKIHDGWDTVPYPSTCYKSEYHSKTCYRNNGNGSKSSYECGSSVQVPYSCTKTKQVERYHYVPHMQTWYWYDIDRWTQILLKQTSGTNHTPVYDPVQPDGDKQRRIEIPGTYTVNFSAEDPGPFNHEYDLKSWLLFNPEGVYQIEVNPVHAIITYPNPVLP